jgi:K(+)-stimulated pyrophosphate-energized sodium pump
MYVVSFLALAVQAQIPAAPAYVGNDDGRIYLWVALAVGVLALVAAGMLARAVIASDTGTTEMQAISNAIREGAEAFLRRQYTTIGEIAAALAIVLFVGYHMSARTSPYALKTVISCLVGAVCSGRAGYTGMYCSIRANIRTASAARTSLNKALQMALRGGAVTGLVVVALSLLGVGSLFLFFGGLEHPAAVPYQLVGLGLRFAGGAVCAGGGSIRRPRTWVRTWWEGGGGDSGGRSAESGCDCGPGGGQCRRLRWPWSGHL